MLQKKVIELIKETAKELNLDEEIVEKVFISQFKVMKDASKSFDIKDFSTFKNVRIKHICLIYTYPTRLEKYSQYGLEKYKETLLPDIQGRKFSGD